MKKRKQDNEKELELGISGLPNKKRRMKGNVWKGLPTETSETRTIRKLSNGIEMI